MERFTGKDVQAGFKICNKCKVRVYILKNGDKYNFTQCVKCGTNDTVTLKEFKENL